jgi:hypothetical protein
MFGKPKDHTVIHTHTFSDDGHFISTETVYYKNYPRYSHLPDVVKSPQTKKEYVDYHAWRETTRRVKLIYALVLLAVALVFMFLAFSHVHVS